MTKVRKPATATKNLSRNAIEKAFGQGDLMQAALNGHHDQWQHHAAIGVIRDSQDGLDGLASFDHDEARFHSAVLSWMDGDEDTACRALEKLDDAYAQNLLALIRKPKIEVLSYLPPVRHGFFVIADAIGSDEKFTVRNIGSFPGDLPSRPFASVHEYYDKATPPDFFSVNLIEWHQIPTDMQELPCPTIGFTNDFDMHIQGMHRWLAPFDCRVVIDHVVELPKVQNITGSPTITYPMVFGIPDDMPPLNADRPHDIDVFFSGTLVSGYHPDKERFLFQLFSNKSADVLLIDGHLSVDRYLDILSRSKITPSYCRHPGGIQTRVIESLCMGSLAMVQPESIMHLWAGEDDGLFTFNEDEGPGPTIERILANYGKYHAGCIANMGRLRGFFKPNRIASRFFRYCTVLAARPRDGCREADPFLNQKRTLFAHGPSLEPFVAAELATENAARMAEEFTVKDEAWIGIERAREGLLLYARAVYDFRMDDAKPELLTGSLNLLDKVAVRFPGNLVCRFNALRARLHFGGPGEFESAVRLGEAIVGSDSSKWDMDPRDDVLPYDFFDHWFNYREYLDEIVDLLGEHDEAKLHKLRDLIIASVHHYLAAVLSDPVHAGRACELDKAFKRYQLTYAELLIDKGTLASAQMAADILAPLSMRSTLSRRAHSLLLGLKERFPGGIKVNMAGADALNENLRESLLQIEHHHLKVNSPYFKNDVLGKDGNKGIVCHRSPKPSIEMPLLSIVLCGMAGRSCGDTLNALATQSLLHSLYEIIYVDCYATVPVEAEKVADWIVTLDQREFLESQASGFYEGIKSARGELVMIVQPGESPEDDFLTDILTTYFGNTMDREVDVVESPSRTPLNIVLIGDPGIDKQAPSYTVFPISSSASIGGILTIEPFQGNMCSVTNLIDRMARSGTPVLKKSGKAWHQTSVTPWWAYGGSSLSSLASICGDIWPDNYDVQDTMPITHSSPSLVEEGETCNIVFYLGTYYIAPQALGAIDWGEVKRRGHPDVFEAHSLSQAQQILYEEASFKGQRPDAVFFGEARRTLAEFLMVHCPGGDLSS